eukprot:7638212-Alexandrium_andersonii.AAC.1
MCIGSPRSPTASPGASAATTAGSCVQKQTSSMEVDLLDIPPCKISSIAAATRAGSSQGARRTGG